MLAITGFALLKFVHVLLAIVAVGFTASYGIWIARAAREPEHQSHVLRGIKFLDDRIANPAFALLLVTGLLMVWVGHLSLTTFWIAAALALYVVLVVVAFTVFTPTLRRQIQALEAEGAGSAEFQRLGTRGRVVGIVLGILVIAIVFLMVTKPTL